MPSASTRIGNGFNPVRATISLITAWPGFSTPMVVRPDRWRTAQSRLTACAKPPQTNVCSGPPATPRTRPRYETSVAAPASLGCRRRRAPGRAPASALRGTTWPTPSREGRVVRQVRPQVVARRLLVRLRPRHDGCRPPARFAAWTLCAARGTPPLRAGRRRRPRGRGRRRAVRRARGSKEASFPASACPRESPREAGARAARTASRRASGSSGTSSSGVRLNWSTKSTRKWTLTMAKLASTLAPKALLEAQAREANPWGESCFAARPARS